MVLIALAGVNVVLVGILAVLAWATARSKTPPPTPATPPEADWVDVSQHLARDIVALDGRMQQAVAVLTLRCGELQQAQDRLTTGWVDFLAKAEGFAKRAEGARGAEQALARKRARQLAEDEQDDGDAVHDGDAGAGPSQGVLPLHPGVAAGGAPSQGAPFPYFAPPPSMRIRGDR